MLTLDTLNVMLAVSEEGLIEEMIIALLASPQLAVFFEKFPRLKAAITDDVPRWREALRSRLKDARVPPELTEEVMCYQQSQLLSTPQFIVQLPQILDLLHRLNSPWAEQARQLVDANSTITSALHTLFLQRWRLSLIVQATTLNQQLLEEEREQLLSEVQERMTLSGQLEPILADNNTAAGRLWDMSAGQLKRGDYQLIVKYGEFLNEHPELKRLAEQLGRSREAKSIPRNDAQMETFRTMVREPATVPEQVDGLQQSDDILRLLPPELATLGITELEYEFYRRLVEKQLLTYRLHGESWREKVIERPVVHKDYDEQPRGPFIVCVDTSGSMGGFNEQCAKAFCLALMRIALAENRRCYIMLFSTEIVRYELSGPQGIEQAIRFLSQQFRGGTDLASCFRAIMERLQSREWFDADAVVISDFIAQRLPDDVTSKVKELQRVHQHRFHAVAMSAHGKPGIMRIFDHIWRFDTGMRSRLLTEKVMISDRLFIQKAEKGEPLEIWGDPQRLLETCSVEDFLQIVQKCAESNLDGGLYNIGSGGSTLDERIHAIVDVFSNPNKRSEISYAPNKRSSTQFVLDISKTKSELGYQPAYNWKKFCEWFKEERKQQRFAKLWGTEEDYQ